MNRSEIWIGRAVTRVFIELVGQIGQYDMMENEAWCLIIELMTAGMEWSNGVDISACLAR